MPKPKTPQGPKPETRFVSLRVAPPGAVMHPVVDPQKMEELLRALRPEPPPAPRSPVLHPMLGAEVLALLAAAIKEQKEKPRKRRGLGPRRIYIGD